MSIWFTSDTHFGHDAIRLLADRPFASVEEMDNELVRRWNSVVKPGDTVWHLGDFSFRNMVEIADYRARLNGTVHLIAGNHDERIVAKHSMLFASIQTMAEVRSGGHVMILCHYPLREWDKAWRGSWHLHGHVHGRLDSEPHGYSLDVGVDSHDYTPIGVKQIEVLLAGRHNPFEPAADRAAARAASARQASEQRKLLSEPSS